MDRGTQINYARSRVQPDAIDVEAAKHIILNHLQSISQATFEPIGSSQLISNVTNQKHAFDKPVAIEAGYESQMEEQLTVLRAELAAREAILSLYAHGVLIAYGVPLVPSGDQIEQRFVTFQNYPTDIRLGPIFFPSVYPAYRLAASFKEDQSVRLASGSIYLSNLAQDQLPSRAKRCLKESIAAYRYGLYLSATMAVGAASESLWMKLASLIRNKQTSVSNEIGKQLDRLYPSINSVIKETWQVLVSHFDTELKQIFSNNGERNIFRDHAIRLCDRRNYAMHKEEADEDEPLFTRYETANLLLASIRYFNQLTKLVAAIENLP